MIENIDKIEQCKKEIKDLVRALEQEFGHIIITSGFRTAAHNKRVSGVKNSSHCLGEGVDMVVQNVQCIKVASWVLHNIRKYPVWGIGIDVYQNYVHLDIKERPMLAIWSYGKSGRVC